MHRRHGPFGNFDFCLSLFNRTPRIFLIKVAAFWEEIYLFISYLPSSSGYDVMLWAPAITWNGLCTSRWSLHKIFGKYVLCTETEWRGMFISNRSRKGNIIGFACLTTENYNRYLKNYLYVYLLWLFSLISWDLFTSIYLPIFYNFASYLKYHFIISSFRHFVF